jgi:hypothetical protein
MNKESIRRHVSVDMHLFSNGEHFRLDCCASRYAFVYTTMGKILDLIATLVDMHLSIQQWGKF